MTVRFLFGMCVCEAVCCLVVDEIDISLGPESGADLFDRFVIIVERGRSWVLILKVKLF